MVSTKTRQIIWAKGAGRCYLCNAPLIGDLISGNEDGNFGFVAHIIAEKATGPRGDPIRSPLLADDHANLILACYPHHKLIDVDELNDYPEQRLLDLKSKHEDRVQIVTDIMPDRASHVLRYGAKIGEHNSPLSFPTVRTALLPTRYPADNQSIGIEITGNAVTDAEETFWDLEANNLRRQFDTIVRPRITSGEIKHLSVFGLGPMPLLTLLGSLLGDILPIDVYQRHREPIPTWSWANDGKLLAFKVDQSSKPAKKVALKLGVSAIITDERIQSVIGVDVPIWSVTSDPVGNDVMRNASDLREFRRLMRGLYDNIKSVNGEDAEIHVFPAVPVSVAIELGRVRMPKSDLPLVMYDNIIEKGFVPRLRIG